MNAFVKNMHDVLDAKNTPPVTNKPYTFGAYDPHDPYDPYDMSGYGREVMSHGKSSYNQWDRRHSGVVTKTAVSSAPIKRVMVLHSNGEEDTYTVPYDCSGWFDLAKEVWPTVDNTMRVPVDRCTFSYGEPKFNACVYTATNDYMQARWGRKLDDSDRRWLAAHPLSTNDGVPQEYTATCIDQLVTPYGLRVSRVRLRKGSLVIGDSLMQWIHALGCNPMALANRSTSNAEAAAALGMTLDQANALWRVEFTDDPLPCSIIGERGWSGGTGVLVGNFGGHARYLAPRARANDWFISVQLETDTAVSHLTPAPNPEYVARKGEPTLLLGSITGLDGIAIAERKGSQWVRFGAPNPTPATAVVPSTQSIVSTGVHETSVPSPKTKPLQNDMWQETRCDLCHQPGLSDDFVDYANVCTLCVEDLWYDFSCPHCKGKFSVEGPPTPVACDDTDYEWSCSACHETLSIGVNDETLQNQDLRVLSEHVFLGAQYVEDMNDTPPTTLGDDEDRLLYGWE